MLLTTGERVSGAPAVRGADAQKTAFTSGSNLAISLFLLVKVASTTVGGATDTRPILLELSALLSKPYH